MGFLESQGMVLYYLSIHSKAVNQKLKEIFDIV